MVEIVLAAQPMWAQWKKIVEGPTRKQALGMAAYRRQLLAQEAAAVAAGDDDTALDFGCEAWDVENELKAYGLDPETGKPVKA